MKAHQKLSKARTLLVLRYPFWSSLMLKLPMRADEKCPTLATDGNEIMYNPKFIEELEDQYITTAVAHESAHVFLLHHLRRGDRDPVVWNYAGDYVINQILQDSNLPIKQGWLLSEEFKGLSTERVYELIMDKIKENPQSKEGMGQGQVGDVIDATGKDGKPLSETERQDKEVECEINAEQAITQAKLAGNLPAGLERMVNDIVAPKIPWIQILARFAEDVATGDQRWFPPNIRHIHNGLYLPSNTDETLGSLVIGIDTSGSTQSYIPQFQGEVNGIAEDYNPEITVVYCDTEVAGVEVFEPDDYPVHLKFKGGGGTELKPMFDYVTEHGLNPTCMVVLTDGEFNYECIPEPWYPVLWVLTEEHPSFKPSFGEITVINQGGHHG